MTPLTTISQTILDTILSRLALLFLSATAGDTAAARQTAIEMLAAYNAQTPDELTLAAEVVSLTLHTLDALNSAAAPDLSPNQILRLRGSAIGLSREKHKALRKLDQLQRARRPKTKPGSDAPQQTTVPSAPETEDALAPVPAQPAATPAKTPAKPLSFQALRKQQMARTITENMKKNQAKFAGQSASPAADASGPPSA